MSIPWPKSPMSKPPEGKGRFYAEISKVLIRQLKADALAHRQKVNARLEAILEANYNQGEKYPKFRHGDIKKAADGPGGTYRSKGK